GGGGAAGRGRGGGRAGWGVGGGVVPPPPPPRGGGAPPDPGAGRLRHRELVGAGAPPLSRLRTRRPPAWMPVRIGLTADLRTIDQRLTERSRDQVARGLIEETRAALAFGVPPDAPVLTGIGYAEAMMHINGEVALEELAGVMARSNWRYARRQLRWLRRNRAITWFDATADPVPRILEFLQEQRL